MKTGNYKVKNGKVHRYIHTKDELYLGDYLCGLGTYDEEDKKTTKPVTCKNCLKRMKK